MRRYSGARVSIPLLLNALAWGASLQGEDSPEYSYWVSSPDILSKEYTEAQGERKKTARSDLDLEKMMQARGY